MDNLSLPIIPPGINEPEPNDIIWRYFPIDRLCYLLKQKRLTFASPKLFMDKSEGNYSSANKQEIFIRLTKCNSLVGETIFNNLHYLSEKMSFLFKNQIYINCWYVAEDESMSMWDRYAEKGCGVAIQTSYSKLKNYLNDKFFIGLVNYYKDEPLPINPIFRFFYKNNIFADEKELRIIFYLQQLGLALKTNSEAIYHVAIEPENMIENVIIGPHTDPGQLDLLYEAVGNYKINIKPSKYASSILWKMHPMLETLYSILKKYALDDCPHCFGKGYIDREPFDEPLIKRRFCENCKIHENWLNIQLEILKLAP